MLYIHITYTNTYLYITFNYLQFYCANITYSTDSGIVIFMLYAVKTPPAPRIA